MKSVNETLFETSLMREDIAGIFEAFAEAFKEGKVDLHNRGDCLTLIPANSAKLQIKATQEIDDSHEECKLVLTLDWQKENS